MTEKKRFDLVDANLIGNESRGITDFDENKHYNMIHDDYKIRDLLNELNDTNNQLREEIKDFQDLLASKEELFLKPVMDLIDEKIKEKEYDLKRSVKAGMPTGLMYSEIELLEDLKKELSGDV